jgi:hypothetical protein
MPDDHDRALGVLRWLGTVNPEGRINTDAAVKFADAADRNHGRHVLNLLEGESWVKFAGLYSHEVEITETGRNELAYLDGWEAAAPAAVPSLTGRARLLATDPGLYADVVLQRIYDASDAHPGRMIDCPSPEHGLSPNAVMTALWRWLVPARLVRITRVPPPPDLPEVALTPEGCAYVRHAREVMADPAIRCRKARGALLAWVHDRREDPAPARVTEFSENSRGTYRGRFFSPHDVSEAAQYLRAQGLAIATGRGGRLAVHITQAGIDCVQRGADVADLGGAADDAGTADDKARGSAATFCGVLATIGWAAVAALITLSKYPVSNPWFILSLIVAVAATVLFVLAGGPDLLRWLGLETRRLWRATHGRLMTSRAGRHQRRSTDDT